MELLQNLVYFLVGGVIGYACVGIYKVGRLLDLL